MRKRSIFSEPMKSAKAAFISDVGGGKKNKISVSGVSLIKTISLLSLGALLHSTLSSIFRSAGVSPIEPKNANSKSQEQVLSPFFSIKPLTKSLHPKYKLWTEMNEKEKDEAVKMAQKIMSKYALKIAPKDKTLNQWRSIKHGTCEFEPSVGRNGHTLCGPKLQPPCNFISFGINDDPSFDRDLGDWGCLGFAGDPTVHHPSKLHEKVTFHNIGATMLQDNEERQVNKGGQEEWWMTSFPKLRYFLGLDKIDILKIDCEGELHLNAPFFIIIV